MRAVGASPLALVAADEALGLAMRRSRGVIDGDEALHSWAWRGSGEGIFAALAGAYDKDFVAILSSW